MPSGFEIKNNQGSFQITQETSVYSFLRKGVVNMVRRSAATNFLEVSQYAEIPCNSLTEICAIRSSGYVSVLFSEGGKLYIGSEYKGDKSTYPPVEYWIFGKATSVSREGIQVFDGKGTGTSNLLYDSSWIPIKPTSLENIPALGIKGSGLPAVFNKTLPRGKSFAYIPMVVHSKTSRSVRELNQSGVTDQEWEISYDRRDDAARIVNGVFSVAPSYVSYYFYFLLGYAPWNDKSYTSDNKAATKYLMIDVSGL